MKEVEKWQGGHNKTNKQANKSKFGKGTQKTCGKKCFNGP